MPHVSEYEVETKFIDRLESIGYPPQTLLPAVRQRSQTGLQYRKIHEASAFSEKEPAGRSP